MPRTTETRSAAQLRTLIADTAARLIAEQGIGDYAQAKRKALHSLGLPERTPLPENGEVESAVRTYQRIFQGEEQSAHLARLRRKACQIMALVERFNAYLSGPVLDGSAGRYAEIDIQLYTDSAKDVEIFLLNQRLPFSHSVPRSERAEAVLTLDDDEAVINLIVYPANEERVVWRTRDGRVRPHARRAAVEQLLDQEP